MWQTKLIDWYQKHKRDLPWRRESHCHDPYKIWVSEIMLQQTTVETVIPYYEKFLKRFPTIQSLAASPEDDVLKMWSGLGYYSRARNLQKAARILNPPPSRGGQATPFVKGGGVQEEIPPLAKGGFLPSTVEELIHLPGIGRYTAGAIASIAFNQCAPILDGNVMRVLSRLYKISEDPKSPQGQKVFWKKAEEILTAPYGDFNQALMELGATICKPTSPLCERCPVARHCQAYQEGCAIDFPKLPKRVASVSVQIAAAVIEKNGDVLMIRRGERGLLKNMWEFPMIEGSVENLLKKLGLKASLNFVGPIKHSVLNRRLTIQVYRHSLVRHFSPKETHQWISPKNIHDIPTSSMNKKILKAALS